MTDYVHIKWPDIMTSLAQSPCKIVDFLQCVRTFIHTKIHMPSSSSSIVVTVKINVNVMFCIV